MRRVLFLILILISISACATSGAKPVCRHWAPFYAYTYHDRTKKKVRLIVYPTSPTTSHVEAQSLESDGWHYLKWSFWSREVVPGKLDTYNEWWRTYALQEFMEKCGFLDEKTLKKGD